MLFEKSLTIFFPCYNDAATIGSLIAKVDKIAKELAINYEIIVIDDGSLDRSPELLLSLKEKYEKLQAIFHEKNKGYGVVLRSGFINSTKELIFYTDGDGQYDVKELPVLLSFMREGVDVVNGYKIQRQDPIYRIVMGRVYYWIVRLLFNLKLKDINCDFRLIRRTVLDKINLKSNSGAICVEMMKKFQDSGCKILEVPVHHCPRLYSKSQFFNFTNLSKMALELIRFWWENVFKKDIYK